MKLAYLFENNSIGGAEIYALNLAKEAKKSGHEVVFVLNKEGEMSKRLKQEGIEFALIPMESSFNPIKMFSSVLSLRKYFLEHKVQIVHTQMLREHSLSIGAKFLGAKVKVVRTFHRLDQFDWKMAPLMWFYRWQTDSIIAISEYMREYLFRNGFKKKVSLIYNGIPAVKAESHQKNLGYLGRLTEEKGIYWFIEENRELFIKDKLIVAGDGPSKEEVENLINNDNIKDVELLGQVDNLAEFFSKISVLVLPSETEVMPLAALEAFSCGVPVVTFKLESLAGIITNENGLLVEGGYSELGAKAVKLLHDSNQMNKKSNRARIDYKEKFNIDLMWKNTENIYSELVGINK